MNPFDWCQGGNPPAPRHDHGCSSRRRVQASPSIVRPSLDTGLLVDAVETRHRCLLSARYAAEAKRDTYTGVCGGRVQNTVSEETPGAFSFFFHEGPHTSLFSPGTTVYWGKKKRSSQGALTEDITVLYISPWHRS